MKIGLFTVFGVVSLALVFLMTACRANAPKKPNQALAPLVNVEKFMGKWYVHGYTPTAIDKEAFGATESYTLEEDGTIKTTYRFRKGGADGKVKEYHPVGRVFDEETGAEWRMTFFGVIKSAYYILYVDPKYEYTVIGHPNKKMAWIMSRRKEIAADVYERLKKELVKRDYELGELRRVEH